MSLSLNIGHISNNKKTAHPRGLMPDYDTSQEGFEPPTVRLEGVCSIQLSYWDLKLVACESSSYSAKQELIYHSHFGESTPRNFFFAFPHAIK